MVYFTVTVSGFGAETIHNDAHVLHDESSFPCYSEGLWHYTTVPFTITSLVRYCNIIIL